MSDHNLRLIYLQKNLLSKTHQIIITTLKDDNSLSEEATFQNDCRNVTSIAVFESEDIFYTSSWNGTISLWKLIAKKWYCTKTYDYGGSEILQLCIQGNILVSLDSNDTVTIYNCQPIAGELEQIQQINDIEAILTISLNKSMLAICTFYGSLILFTNKLNLWKQFQEIVFPRNANVFANFSPISDYLAIIDPNKTLSIWLKKEKYHPFQKFDDQKQIKYVEFSKDGTLFVTVCSKNIINIWEFRQTWIIKQEIFTNRNIYKAIFQAGSEYLIIIGRNCIISKSLQI